MYMCSHPAAAQRARGEVGDLEPRAAGEAEGEAERAREERARDDSSCAVDFGSQSTVQMDMVEPADVEVVDDSAAAAAAVDSADS